jgi:hypothetical protein
MFALRVRFLKPLTHGAEDRDRTCDLLITKQLLYHLSYFGKQNIMEPTLAEYLKLNN